MEELERRIEQLQALVDDPAVRVAGSAQFEGRRVTFSQLVALLSQAESARDIEVRTRRETQETERIESANVRNRVIKAERKFRTATSLLNREIDKGRDTTEYLSNWNKALDELIALDPQNKLIPESARVTEEPFRATGQPTGVTGRVARAVPDGDAGANAAAQPTVTPTETPAPAPAGAAGRTGVGKTAPKTDTAGQAAFVQRELKNRDLADTPANRRRLRDEYKNRSSDTGWLDTFRQDYPAYASWTSEEIAQYFGQDFIDVLYKASDPDVEYSDDEIRRMVRQTAYYNKTTSIQQTFDKSTVANQNLLTQTAIESIREAYGDLNFTEADLQTLGRKVARDGLSGIGLQQEVFRTAFRSQAPREVQTQALTGAEADKIQRIARSFGRSATNDEIQSILSGQPTADGLILTTEMYRQMLQQEAIAAFPQFQKQIEAGLSLETIGRRYRDYAAELLEMDPEQIDMFSGPYLKAFGDSQNGPMSLGDWVTTVKSDPTFGWQYTNTANQQATDIGLTLARAFGGIQ